MLLQLKNRNSELKINKPDMHAYSNEKQPMIIKHPPVVTNSKPTTITLTQRASSEQRQRIDQRSSKIKFQMNMNSSREMLGMHKTSY